MRSNQLSYLAIHFAVANIVFIFCRHKANTFFLCETQTKNQAMLFVSSVPLKAKRKSETKGQENTIFNVSPS
tara:strand:+ start:44 stop:259 length:216 start_codon:yes stop_codon:yes gene_type:complete